MESAVGFTGLPFVGLAAVEWEWTPNASVAAVSRMSVAALMPAR